MYCVLSYIFTVETCGLIQLILYKFEITHFVLVVDVK